MSTFDEVVTTQPVDDGVYAGHFTEDWLQGRGCYGGLVTGAALEAMAHYRGDRPLRSIDTSFIGPVVPGDIEVHVEVLREGRTLVWTGADVRQHGDICARITATFGSARNSTIVVEPTPPSPTLALPDTQPVPYIEGLLPQFFQHLDVRWSEGQPPFSGASAGIVGGYCRHKRGATHSLGSVVALIDAWPPATLPMLTRPAPANSVRWNAQLTHDAMTPPSDGWYWYRGETIVARDGYATVKGRLYADSRLVAWSEQLTLVFDKPS